MGQPPCSAGLTPPPPSCTISTSNQTKMFNPTKATRTELLIAEVQGSYSVKRLKRRGPRKGETWNKDCSSGRPALGSHDTSKGSYVGKGDIAIGAGRMGTLNPVKSLGRAWSGDKDANAAAAARQHRADRIAAARDRLMGL